MNEAIGKATLITDGKEHELDILGDNGDRRYLDIRKLKETTNLHTYDPGFANTAACSSSITLVRGDEGKLIYRGYAIEDLAEYCTFVGVAYLLVNGKLPTAEERKKFRMLLNSHSMIHEDMRNYFGQFPEHSHPMAVLSAMVVSLSSFYPELRAAVTLEEYDITATRLLSKMRTIAAFAYKKSIGEPFVYPDGKLDYCSNFLNMMFSSPVNDYEISPEIVKAMNQLLIIHADHGQNCSTSTVRLVASSGPNLYASISAGICALWGPLHGGANERVVKMLKEIHSGGEGLDKVIERAQDKNDPFRLMGFGHRVYKTYDPRAKIARDVCYRVLNHLGVNDPLLEIAVKLEEKALGSTYFQERNLFPNVDFYTGITYRALGFPTNMYTVLFALGRIPGWIAQWIEFNSDPSRKISRPTQRYMGLRDRAIVALNDR